jgi:hypothetical protein
MKAAPAVHCRSLPESVAVFRHDARFGFVDAKYVRYIASGRWPIFRQYL